MKAIKLFLITVLLFSGLSTGNNLYAQYAPGQQLPSLGFVAQGAYDYVRGSKGFVRCVGDGNTTPDDMRVFSIHTQGLFNTERFRVSANGTTSIIGQDDNQPSLNFYTSNLFYLASIGIPGEVLNISSIYGMKLNPNKQTKAYFRQNRTDLFTPLYLPLKGSYNENQNIGFIVGKNNDPTMRSTFNERLRIGAKNGIAFWGNGKVNIDNEPQLLIGSDRVTIGKVSNPNYMLNVGGNIYIEKEGVQTYFGRDSDKDDIWIGTKSKHGFYLGTNNASCLYFDADHHNTYIGLIDTSVAKIRQELKQKYRLFVAKGILSEDYAIGPQSSWSDFVFNKDYALKTILQVEAFISENNHLPNVPSAKQVAEEGYSQHEMNKILLQKIEELTLYTIQQQKEIQELKTELNNLKK